MSSRGKKTGSVGIKLGAGSSVHLENVHFEGVDTPISMDLASRATLKNVTTSNRTSDVIGGSPAVGTLHMIAKGIENIVLAIEVETAKHLI